MRHIHQTPTVRVQPFGHIGFSDPPSDTVSDNHPTTGGPVRVNRDRRTVVHEHGERVEPASAAPERPHWSPPNIANCSSTMTQCGDIHRHSLWRFSWFPPSDTDDDVVWYAADADQ